MPNLGERLADAPKASITISIIGDEDGFRIALSFGDDSALVSLKVYDSKEGAVSAAKDLKTSLIATMGDTPRDLTN